MNVDLDHRFVLPCPDNVGQFIVFQPVEHNEDVALVEALIANGASIAWSAAPRVVTSARTDFRALKGFGATLVDVSRRCFLSKTDEDGAMAA